jgi:nucleoside 2-deoxyribosyltransferase
MQNNILKDATVYLSGPIEYASDHGIGWRQEFTELTKDIGLKILDPTNKPKNLFSETEKEKSNTKQLKENNDLASLRKFAKQIRRIDLRLLDFCSFLVAYIDPKVHMFGTIDEIITAERQQKPLLCIVNGKKTDMSLWAYAIFKEDEIFTSVKDCVDYIKKIDSGEMPIDNRWILI